jgi:hypothetical protein
LPRESWKVKEWRRVALSLAGIENKETRGRKKRTEAEAYEEEQNLLALEFQIKQELEFISQKQNVELQYQAKKALDEISKKLEIEFDYYVQKDDEKSGLLIPRKKHQSLSKKTAIKNILRSAAQQETGDPNKKPPKLDGLIKRLQTVRKKHEFKK